MDELNELLKKQAQDFVLTPSPSVWLNVEADIARRERRRRWFFWLFFVCFVSGGLVLYRVFAGNNKQVTDTPKHIVHEKVNTVHEHRNDVPGKESSIKLISKQEKQTENSKDQPIITNGPDDVEQAELTSVPYQQEPVDAVVPIERTLSRPVTQHPGKYSLSSRQYTPLTVVLPEKEEMTTLKAVAPANMNPLPATINRVQAIARADHHAMQQTTPVQRAEEEQVHILKRADKAGIPVSYPENAPKQYNKAFAAALTINTEKEHVHILKRADKAGIPVSYPEAALKQYNKAFAAALPISTEEEHVHILKRADKGGIPVSYPETALKEYNKAFAAALPIKTEEEPATASSEKILPESGQLTPEIPVPQTISPLRKNRWSFTASFAPAMNFSKVRENNDSFFVAQTRKNSRQLVSGNYSIAAWYRVSPRLELFSGLGIRNVGERMKAGQNIYALDSGFVSNTQKKVVVRKILVKPGDSSDLITNRFTYLEIPLGVRFRMAGRKQWNLYFNADVSASYLVAAKGYYYNFEKRGYLAMDNDRLKSWLLAYGAGISMEYKVHKYIGLECMPYFRNYPSSIYKADKQNLLSQYLMQSGVQFSLRFYPGANAK